MKKIFAIIVFAICTVSAYAQTAEDALLFSQENFEGTARTMAMGNAFTALGGDVGALSINPAASGVMRCSQITFSPGFTTAKSQTSYLGDINKDGNTAFTLSNFGSVLSFDTNNYSGLLNFNFGFAYNKKNSYRSTMYTTGRTDGSSYLASLAEGLSGFDCRDLDIMDYQDPFYDTNASWPGILAWNTFVLSDLNFFGGHHLGDYEHYAASTENYDKDNDVFYIGGYLDQTHSRVTKGSNEEYVFNFGGNIDDIVYFGVNLNLSSIDYMIEETYSEVAEDPDDFEDGFDGMTNEYWQHTTGAGFNAKFGIIVNPVGGLRLGATVSTPTWYDMTDNWDWTMCTSFNNGHRYTEGSPTGAWEYKLTTPWRWSVGAAYTLYDLGLISVDYECVDYSSTVLKGMDGRLSEYSGENSYMQSSFGTSSTIRAGLEIRPTPVISLRGGYIHSSAPVYYYNSTDIVSCGIGFNFNQTTSLDFAWSKMLGKTSSYTLYDGYSGISAPEGLINSSLGKVVCTLALRF